MWKIYSLCRIKKYKLDNVKLVVSKNEKLPIIIVVRLGRSIHYHLYLKILDIERVDTLLKEYSSEYSSLN